MVSFEFRHYNTGDKVWLRDGVVVRVETHDGLQWRECFSGRPPFIHGGYAKLGASGDWWGQGYGKIGGSDG